MLSRRLRRFFGFGCSLHDREALRRRFQPQIEALGQLVMLSGLTPIPVPINATEGMGYSGIVGEFTDSDGNTDLSKYNSTPPTVTWGNGNFSFPYVSYLGNGVFAVNDMHMGLEEGTY